MARSTGDDVLDRMLGGGLPEAATTVVRGEPASGARRLAAGAVRAGLDDGERCLLLVGGADRDRPTDDLAVGARVVDGTIQPVDGESIDAEPAALPEAFDDGFDRVLLEGTVELAAATGEADAIPATARAFASTGASVVVTAGAGVDLVPDADAVVECWREPVAGDPQPFVRVLASRTGDHDGRRHRLALEGDRASVVARDRSTATPRLQTEIEAFDDLTGGGFVRGGVTVFEYEQGADHWPFTAAVCTRVITRGARVVLITAPGVVTGDFDEAIRDRLGPAEELMAADDLYMIDTVSPSPGASASEPLPDENVVVEAETGSLQESIRSLLERLAGRPVLAVIELTSVLHLLTEDEARQLFYWARANVLAVEGWSLVVTVDPNVAGDSLTAFLGQAAEQTSRTWRGDDGLQYLSVAEAPDGDAGHVAVVEPTDEWPPVTLR